MGIIEQENINKKDEDVKTKLDLDVVTEVSVVDHPANKRPFLIVKRDDQGNIETSVEKQDMQTENTSVDFFDILGIPKADNVAPVATESAGTTEQGQEVLADTPEVINLPSEGSDGINLETPTQEVVEKSVVTALQTLTEVVNKGRVNSKFSDQEIQQIKKVSLDLIVVADQMGASVEPAVKIEKAVDPVASVTRATEQLVKASNDIKAQKGSPFCSTTADSVKSVAILLQKSVTTEEQEAVKEVPQIQVFKASSSDDSDNPEIIIKAGAKMKKVRLNQFEKAVRTLQSLLKELRGDTINKNDDITPGVSKADIEAGLQKGFGLLETMMVEKMEAMVKANTDTLTGKIEQVEKRFTDINNASPTGNADSDVDAIKKNEEPNMWGSLSLLK